MSNFRYTPYVTVPGLPRLEPGMTVQALLREKDNWKSLVGWRDLDTGELAVPNPNWHLRRLLFFFGWLSLLLFIVGREALQPELPLAFIAFLLVLFWAFFLRSEYKAWRQAQRDLKALQEMRTKNEV